MSRQFNVLYNPKIYEDIQEAIDFYKRKSGSNEIGSRFLNNVRNQLLKLEESALHYQVRYDDIRLIPIPSFPLWLTIELMRHTTQ